MRLKMVFKLTVDIFMTLALLFLMGYQFWGEAPHEWVGTGMFLLFIAHHILNINWYRHLFQGKYSAMRIGMLWVDILVLISMLVQMYSGIAMSRHIFTFLPSVGGMAWTPPTPYSWSILGVSFCESALRSSLESDFENPSEKVSNEPNLQNRLCSSL